MCYQIGNMFHQGSIKLRLARVRVERRAHEVFYGITLRRAMRRTNYTH
jgi:hypothetical protein